MVKRGPSTAGGKAASSRNALTHGLRSEAPVVRQVESIEDWERHLEAVIASREPEGYLETELTVRIAEILWRLRRVSHYEADKISVALDHMPDDYAATARYGAAVTGRPIEESMTLEKIEMQTGIRMIPDGETLKNITRYESHLHRQLLQTSYLAPRASYLVPRTSCLVPRTSHLVPRTSYLVPRTSYLVPRTSYLVPRNWRTMRVQIQLVSPGRIQVGGAWRKNETTTLHCR